MIFGAKVIIFKQTCKFLSLFFMFFITFRSILRYFPHVFNEK